jgi:SAM-dependent methyltransferase
VDGRVEPGHDDKAHDMADWISFFDSDHPIYVNARHRAVHARLVALSIGGYIRKPGMHILDYGCGEAYYAGRIADQCDRLMLCEAAPHLRQSLKDRFQDNEKIAVLSPEDAAALPEGSCDLIIMHSVAQYLTRDEAHDLFVLFRRLVRKDGAFVLGDVVKPDVSAFTDAAALLGLAAANGFFFAALFGLVRTLLSGYWKLRQQAGLTRYSEDEIARALESAGFSAEQAAHNLGHNQARMTFVAKPT